MRMKRWESPRREGRNHKGKRKSARQRQLKKQTQVWRQKLKGDDIGTHNNQTQKAKPKGKGAASNRSFCFSAKSNALQRNTMTLWTMYRHIWPAPKPRTTHAADSTNFY